MSLQELNYRNVTIAKIPIHFNVLHITLREWVFDLLPTIQITFEYQDEFNKYWTLQENDEIVVELGSKTIDKREIVTKTIFELKSWAEIESANGEITTITVVGSLKVTNFFQPVQFRAFDDLSSSVLDELSSELSLEIDKRVDSKDKMAWIQNSTTHKFINHLVSNSWISDKDFLLSFIDRNRKMVVTSILTEIDRQRAKKNFVFWPEAFSEDLSQEAVDKKVYPFIGWNTINKSGIKNLQGGYGLSFNKYDYDKLERVMKDINTAYFTTYGEMSKELRGQGVANIDVHQPPSAHENFWLASHLRKLFFSKFFASPKTIMINADADVNLADIVNVSFLKMQTDYGVRDSFSPVNSGDYLIGGLTHYIEPPHGMKTFATIFRSGFEKGETMEEGDMNMVKKGE